MTIFVTGATGFIGRHLVAQALTEGHDVRALCRRMPDSFPSSPRLKWIVCDLESVSRNELSGADVLIHLAVDGISTGPPEWESCFRVNVSSSLKLWRRAADEGVRRFIIGGSCLEYGRSGERYQFIPVDAPLEPIGAYGASKAAASIAAMGLGIDRKLELAILRPFHIFGDGQNETSFWPSLRRAAMRGEDFPMTLGEQVRNFMPVENVAAQFLFCATCKEIVAAQPLLRNIGSGQTTTLRAFAERWWRLWGATGALRPGAIPYRSNEVMRYVPKI